MKMLLTRSELNITTFNISIYQMIITAERRVMTPILGLYLWGFEGFNPFTK